MRELLFAVLAAMAMEGAGCASTPKAKQPDESRRTPVNASIPAELRQGGATTPPSKKSADVEWR